MKKTGDYHLPLHPTVVVLHFKHNHNINAADALKFRPPSEEVTTKFLHLFQAGHNPARALAIHQQDLQQEHEDEYYMVAADRYYCPDIQWVFQKYYSVFEKEYGKADGGTMLRSLESFISDYNTRMQDRCAQLHLVDDKNFCAVIVSPLMKRVLVSRNAGEVLFVDSTGNVDRFGCKIFLLMVNSGAGGLPAGVILTSSESEINLRQCFAMFQTFLMEESFGGRGNTGPLVLMTDDCSALRTSLAGTFPEATMLLCTFHVLQAAWRYLWNASTGVPINNRQELFSLIKKLLYSKDTETLAQNYTAICQSETVKSFPKVEGYIDNRFERREEWAICYRPNLILRGQHTNNLCEAAMRVLKDKVLLRTKAYSVVQLFDFVTKDLENFYSRKTVMVAAGRPEAYLKKLNTVSEDKLKSLSFKQISSNWYEVKNSSTDQMYSVEMELGLCSCPVGETGGLCKHQIYLARVLQLQLPIALPTTPEDRKHIHFIGTGSTSVPDNWFASLTAIAENTPWENFINETLRCESTSATTSSVAGSPCNTSSIGLSKKTIFEDLDKLTEKLKLEANKSNDVLVALGNMVSTGQRLNTENSIISACNTFGKYSRGLQKTKLYCTKAIGVQPTSYARRKMACGGRRQLQSGRPPKRAYTNEHGYNKMPNSALMPQKRARIAAPHNLSESVAQNKSLGK